MRKIKFRIWHIKRKCFLTNDDHSLHCFSTWLICPFTGKVYDAVRSLEDTSNFAELHEEDYYFDKLEIIKSPPFVLQQFTGYLDKKGKEIYEGDIVRRVNRPSPVEWNQTLCGFSPFTALYDDDSWDNNSCEIIGNIFENSDLLN